MSKQMQPLQRQNIRLAATVVLMRDTDSGPEVFMLKRPGAGDFPDLHVFPGGKVDEQDLLDDQVRGCSEAAANRLLGLQAGGLRYWVTAIRECFEECGVLLARRDGEFVSLTDAAEVARFDDYRQALIEGQMTMVDLCQRESLVLAADCLLYHSHWLTPESAPRRFDTRFFVARMPVAQATAAHAGETDEYRGDRQYRDDDAANNQVDDKGEGARNRSDHLGLEVNTPGDLNAVTCIEQSIFLVGERRALGAEQLEIKHRESERNPGHDPDQRDAERNHAERHQ